MGHKLCITNMSHLLVGMPTCQCTVRLVMPNNAAESWETSTEEVIKGKPINHLKEVLMQTSNLKDDIGNMCKGVSLPLVDRFSEIPDQPKDRRMRLLEAFAYIFTYEVFIINPVS